MGLGKGSYKNTIILNKNPERLVIMTSRMKKYRHFQ